MMKKILSKLSAELVTVWIRFKKNFFGSDFQKARWKISFYYLLVVFLILNIFTFSLFGILQNESQKYQKKVNVYFHQQKSVFMNKNGMMIVSTQPQVYSFQTNDLINYHKIFVDVIQNWLFELEFFLMIIAGLLSYFFAGLSMKPIEIKNERMKKFLADVSHELKNPLSAIKITLEISKNQEDWKVGEAQEVFKDLGAEVSRLIKITDDLLELEKRKTTETEIEEINLKDVILDVKKKLENFSQKKNIEWKTEFEDFYFLAKKNDMEKIFFNLLHNAIKFSKQNGKIELVLKNGIFKIKDYGVGIPKDEQENIFKRFYKIDKARVLNENSGSGLGLAIVKDICEKYKIKINLKSKKNKSTIFILKFK